MGKLSGLLLLLISVMVFSGCKETPSSMVENPTLSELEIKNNLNIKDRWWVELVEVNEDYNFRIEIEPQSNGVILFSEYEVSKLTNLDVRIKTFNIGYDSGNNVITPTPLYLDFTLGERRVVRIVCIELKTPTECESDGITYTIED